MYQFPFPRLWIIFPATPGVPRAVVGDIRQSWNGLISPFFGEQLLTSPLLSFINRENRVPHYQKLFQDGGRHAVRQWNQVRTPTTSHHFQYPNQNEKYEGREINWLTIKSDYRLLRARCSSGPTSFSCSVALLGRCT
jgi:hypothetical protein